MASTIFNQKYTLFLQLFTDIKKLQEFQLILWENTGVPTACGKLYDLTFAYIIDYAAASRINSPYVWGLYINISRGCPAHLTTRYPSANVRSVSLQQASLPVA